MLRLYKNQERITMDGRKFYRNLIDSMERNHYNFFRTDQSVEKMQEDIICYRAIV